MATLLAHHCYCSSCAVGPLPADEIAYCELLAPAQGVVCGHYSLRQRAWLCVYCGKPTVRFTGLGAALVQSARSGLEQVRWELGMGRLSRYSYVRLWAAMRAAW